jgi:hypothetical protein
LRRVEMKRFQKVFLCFILLSSTYFTYDHRLIVDAMETVEGVDAGKREGLNEGTINETTLTIEGDSQDQTKSVSIPNLLDVIDVSSNTGNVEYTIDGNEVLLNLSNGNITRRVQTGGSYTPSDNKTVTDSRTTIPGGSASSLPSSIPYSSDGYTGTLSKDGASYISSGSYKAADSKYVTAQTA